MILILSVHMMFFCVLQSSFPAAKDLLYPFIEAHLDEYSNFVIKGALLLSILKRSMEKRKIVVGESGNLEVPTTSLLLMLRSVNSCTSRLV